MALVLASNAPTKTHTSPNAFFHRQNAFTSELASNPVGGWLCGKHCDLPGRILAFPFFLFSFLRPSSIDRFVRKTSTVPVEFCTAIPWQKTNVTVRPLRLSNAYNALQLASLWLASTSLLLSATSNFYPSVPPTLSPSLQLSAVRPRASFRVKGHQSSNVVPPKK